MRDSFKHKIISSYFPIIIAVIIAFGLATSLYAMRYIDHSIKNSLIERAQTIATALDYSEIDSLAGDETDLVNPEYIALKEKLKALAAANSDVQFVYLMGKHGDSIFFFADSEEPDSEDYSPPGQVYDEGTPEFIEMFTTKTTLLEGPVSDRWGSWISSHAPILNPENGELAAVVGLDIDASSYYETLILYGAIPLLLAGILSLFIFFLYRVHKKDDEFMAFKSELGSIAAHDLKAPLIGINWSLETLLDTDTPLPADHKNALEKIHSTGQNLLKTVNGILENSAGKK